MVPILFYAILYLNVSVSGLLLDGRTEYLLPKTTHKFRIVVVVVDDKVGQHS